MQVSKLRAIAMVALVGAGPSACGDSTGVDGDAHLRVLLTDAAADYIGMASVDIGAVELIPAGGGAPIVLTDDGTDGFIDLLELQDAATMVLGEADIDAGAYTQLRLIVEAAKVTLAEGHEFTDGATEKDLEVPSGAQTGIKLVLGVADGDEDQDGPLIIAPGDMELVLDFDVNQSFVIQGNPETPAGIHGVSFKPTIRVALPSAAGSISGTVSTSLQDVPVGGLTVTAEPVVEEGAEEFQSETATAMTNEDGTYTLHFLVPGSYTVTVTTAAGFVTTPESVEVGVGAAEDVAGVDFEVVASS